MYDNIDHMGVSGHGVYPNSVYFDRENYDRLWGLGVYALFSDKPI